jgi:A/G-specific adenine glycosylase
LSGAAGAVRPAAQVGAIGRAIEQWGGALGSDSRRPDLPWRSTRDPWAVLVSEFMAQQTQLARVVPAYRRFVLAFPTPAACAQASLGSVLRAWQGLGYNRRARNLHRSAAAIVADHGGQVPSDLATLLSLPGVGA